MIVSVIILINESILFLFFTLFELAFNLRYGSREMWYGSREMKRFFFNKVVNVEHAGGPY
jgi:hypothetical protein